MPVNDKILVIGSSNTDMVIKTARLPKTGESVKGTEFYNVSGGKGANQAVALARLGCSNVHFIAKIGNDSFSSSRINDLHKEGIITDNILFDKNISSGVALINVDEKGNNQISVYPGANSSLSISDIMSVEQEIFSDAKFLLLQLEIPLETVVYCLKTAKRYNVTTVLNPSPAVKLENEILELVDIIILNATETEIITGKSARHSESAFMAAEMIIEKGVANVIITQGADGAVLVTDKMKKHIPGYKADEIDSTAAGDSFIGGLIYKMINGTRLEDSIDFANICGAVAVTKMGAQSSIPCLKEIEHIIETAHTNERRISINSLKKISSVSNDIIEILENKSKIIRRLILEMLTEAGSGHPGGSLSAADIMTVLYFHIMKYNPKKIDWDGRDRFILSKGHCCPVLYACLAEAGFFPHAELKTLRKINSILQGHPDRKKTPGVEMSTGSLGQGLSVANGIALGLRLSKSQGKVFVLLGDGEVEEGQIWEAAMTAVHNGLDNICAILDYNGLQIGGALRNVKSTLEPLREKWMDFGWHTITIDGHNIKSIIEAFYEADKVKGKPTIIIAHTIKGKGVSFMERVVEYHGTVLTKEECELALKELK